MKKVLIFLIGILFISCSKEVTTKQDIKEIQYEQAFEKTFGKIDKNQTWGFGKSLTRTADPRNNMWASEGYNVPPAITAAEKAKVIEVFSQRGEESYTSNLDWDCFFVQHVYGSHGNMDWLCAYDPTGHREVLYGLPEYNYQPHEIISHDDHINNFNATDGAIMLMVNSSTQRFGFHSSQDSKLHYNFRLEEIDGSYYVGIDYEANGQWDNQKEARNYIYNDWIVKIVPGKGTSDRVKEEGMIICEDLGTIGDFDFNDVVFYAKVWESGKTEIDILAAGGKIDVNVAGVDVGEVMGKMVNTGLKTVPTYYFVATNKYNSLIDIPIIVSDEDEAGNITSYALSAEKGKAPQKICVPLGFKWCKEYKSLVDAYPGFKDWTTGTSDTWCGEYNSDLVY